MKYYLLKFIYEKYYFSNNNYSHSDFPLCTYKLKNCIYLLRQ